MYSFLDTELEDWQVKSFRFKGQRNKEIENESETFVEERLLINEKQVYTLTLQGLTSAQFKEIYKQIRDNTQDGYKAIFYGIAPDPSDTYYNETVNMNYIGDNPYGFVTPMDYNTVSFNLNGVLYDLSVEVIEER